MLAQLFRSLLPFENPIGFGASDFIELFIAVIVVSLVFVRPAAERVFRSLGKRTLWCMFLLAVLPVALRLLLLAHHPAPSPQNYREFSRLLLADTLRHFRLANPPLRLPQFFGTLGVVQTPSYSSTDPLGQGIALALGRAIFGHPWAGVLLSSAAFCSLSYWMLRAWTTSGWALVGGILTVFEFGPLSQWTNSYAGGAAAAAAACLVFGSLPRVWSSGRMRDAALLGLGVAGFVLTLPYESVFLIVTAILFFLPIVRKPGERSRFMRATPIALAIIVSALLLMVVDHRAVTGSWALSPLQISLPGVHPEISASYLARLEYRIRFYRVFLFPPLYLALLAIVFSIRTFPDLWLLLTLAIFALGVNFEPDVDLTSWAAIAPLLVLVGVRGLQQLSRLIGREAARLIVYLCAAQFVFWYGLHLFETHETAAAMLHYETWDSINHPGLDRRVAIDQQIARLPGRQLVFVHYGPAHNSQDEWVYNDADIARAQTIWARDLGPSENSKVQSDYPDRTVWSFDPDAAPLKLIPYQPQVEVPPAPRKQVSPFEEIH